MFSQFVSRFMPQTSLPDISPTTYGCWYPSTIQPHEKTYLTQTALHARTKILVSVSQTTLIQTFHNQQSNAVAEAYYTFPIYDGASVVSFKYTIGKRIIVGVVKEKSQAWAQSNDAIQQSFNTGCVEQDVDASDLFTTKLGNIAKGGRVDVEITYLAELEYDIEHEGVRFTIPCAVAPRYESTSPQNFANPSNHVSNVMTPVDISIVVDITVGTGSVIRGIQSPSHPIAVVMGRKSSQHDHIFQNNHASASYELRGRAEFDQDFIVIIKAEGQDEPLALLERHPEHGCALMARLTPRFLLPSARPEVMFVVDRSSSMDGKIHLVRQALQIFLRSLPQDIKFNICSIGSCFQFLFDQSRTSDEASLKIALRHIGGINADLGRAELMRPMAAIVQNRLDGMPLEIMVLTAGEHFERFSLLDLINKESESRLRVFSLGIGSRPGYASSIVEGMARAGNGFAQFVQDGEKIDNYVARMLEAALTPHVSNYSLELQYAPDLDQDDDDFEFIESFEENMKIATTDLDKALIEPRSLTSRYANSSSIATDRNRHSHSLGLAIPDILQTPYEIPPLYPSKPTNVCLLFSPYSSSKPIKSVILHARSDHGPLQLKIPVENGGDGEIIHQLAARKAIQELDEGRGWITKAMIDGIDRDETIKQEAVRIGTQYQVAGKYCSFVTVESGTNSGEVDKVLSVVSTSSSPFHEWQRHSFAPFGSSERRQVVEGILSNKHFFQGHQLPPVFNSASTALLDDNLSGLSSRTGISPLATSKEEHEALNEKARSTNSAMIHRLRSLYSLQEIDGSWRKTEQFLETLDIDQHSYDRGLVDIPDQSVKVTALALAWLEIKASNLKDSWAMVAARTAREWLVKQGSVIDAEVLVERARSDFFAGVVHSCEK